MRILVQTIDPGTLTPIRDISAIVDISANASLSFDIDSDIFCSGSIGFSGNGSLVENALIRLSRVTDTEIDVLGTFFADTSGAERIGSLLVGELELEGILAELRDTCTPVAYVCAANVPCIDIIRDACQTLGRPTAIPDTLSSASFSETIIFEAGTSWLQICSEAAERCSMRLSQDALGFVTLEQDPPQGAFTSWSLAPGDTDILGKIEKTAARKSAPTRIVATWSGSGNAISATVDAPARGLRKRDQHVSVSDLPEASVAVLTDIAREELEKASGLQDEWKFTALFKRVVCGAPCEVFDMVDSGKISGVVASIELELFPALAMTVTIRGEAS